MPTTLPEGGEMKVKFTPGPWILRTMSYGFDLCVEGVGGHGCGGWFVELHGDVRTDDTQEFKAEFEANARLISAAPDLLETLKFARRVLNDNGIRCMVGDTDVVSEAISKAEGAQ